MAKGIGKCMMVAMLLLLTACASVYKPQNKLLEQFDTANGYYYYNNERPNHGDHNIVLSFSGGGTRAAALSYGVLQELRDTMIVGQRGRSLRLLDEVDNISSVSGGSFTAAYYGLFGDDIFRDYERVFLRRGVQGTLLRQMLNPVYWWRSMFSAFDRTEMAVEYYDHSIFRDKTFADMSRNGLPFVEINATDLNGGGRFSFTQGMFDLICSDLRQFSVARAVTASSAVPVAFPSVVLENHGGECDIRDTGGWEKLFLKDSADPRMKALRDRMSAYLDAEKKPYVHLVDGGIADNLGLRAIIEREDLVGGIDASMKEKIDQMPKDVLFILVNAEVKPSRSIDQRASKPSVTQTVDAFTDAQMKLYNVETLAYIRQRLREDEKHLNALGIPIRFYFAEVSFSSVKSRHEKDFFNSLPTSLELRDAEVDQLIRAGRELLRQNPDYQAFLRANRGQLLAR
jgi:NTE family protein